MSDNVLVTRRIPTYQFVIRTSRSVRENAQLLESYLINQKRPRGFVVYDPRLAGQVSGSTFSVRQYGAWMWGSLIPTIEGEMIPNEDGSDVLVEVAHDGIWLGVIIALVITVVAVSILLDGLNLRSAGFLVYAIAATCGAALLPILLHGSQAAKMLGSIFAPARSNC